MQYCIRIYMVSRCASLVNGHTIDITYAGLNNGAGLVLTVSGYEGHLTRYSR